MWLLRGAPATEIPSEDAAASRRGRIRCTRRSIRSTSRPRARRRVSTPSWSRSNSDSRRQHRPAGSEQRDESGQRAEHHRQSGPSAPDRDHSVHARSARGCQRADLRVDGRRCELGSKHNRPERGRLNDRNGRHHAPLRWSAPGKAGTSAQATRSTQPTSTTTAGTRWSSSVRTESGSASSTGTATGSRHGGSSATG